MYKIINKVSGNTQIMNQEEKDIFFSHSKTQMSNWDKYGKRNMYGDYDIQEITYLDKIPLWLITGGIFIAAICSMLLHIQLNY
tara:strand:+ start:95 stop:343 length:249 start_codon:yes stop_codon:yes gene_type:complete